MFDSNKTAKLKAALNKEVSLFIRNKQSQRTEEVLGVLEEIFFLNGITSHLRFKKKKGNISVVLYFSGGDYEIVKIKDIVSDEVLYLGI